MKLTANLNVTAIHEDEDVNPVYATKDTFIISVSESSPPEVQDALKVLVKSVLSERLTSIARSS